MDRTLAIIAVLLVILIVILVQVAKNQELIVLTARSGPCVTANCEKTVCTEPKPGLRFICGNGLLVADRANCGGMESCPYAVNRYFICPDQSITDDPQACGDAQAAAAVSGGIRTIYNCSDGRHAANWADCSMNCTASNTTSANVSGISGSGGVVGLAYECWDGRISRSAAGCEPYCAKGCACEFSETPVCANGKTYLNPCIAQCFGASNYSKGPCAPPFCAKADESCTQPGMIGLNPGYLSGYSYPACCAPGSYCGANGTCAIAERKCRALGETCRTFNMTNATDSPPGGRQDDCCMGTTCLDGMCAAAQCVQEYGACESNTDCCKGLGCAPDQQCRTPPQGGAPPSR